MSAAVPGWTLGTLLGALSGSLLPERLLNALGVALYGMFLAIIVPPARENRILRAVVLLSMTASFVFTLIPVLNTIPPDLRSFLLTFVIAGGAALICPVKEEA